MGDLRKWLESGEVSAGGFVGGGTVSAEDAFGFRQVMAMNPPRGGKYGLIHPDGTPCDALRKENCPKMMGLGGAGCSSPREEGGRELDDFDDLTGEQKQARIQNAKNYLRMVGTPEGRKAYNARKYAEWRRREDLARQRKAEENALITDARRLAGEALSDEEVETVGRKLAPVFGHGSEYSKDLMRRYFRDFGTEANAKFGHGFWWRISDSCPPRLRESAAWRKIHDAYLDAVTMHPDR